MQIKTEAGQPPIVAPSWINAMDEQRDLLEQVLDQGTTGEQLLRLVALNELLKRYSADELMGIAACREDH